MSYNNTIEYPISSTLTDDILISQFQDLSISTSYFKYLFDHIPQKSIEKCFVNNTFINDYVDFISLIIQKIYKDNNDSLNSTFLDSTLNSMPNSSI